MTACAEHQPYLAAVADGELELVPRPSLEHLAGCPDCREEVDAHRMLSGRLLEALAAEAPHRSSPGRRIGNRWRRLAAAGAALAAFGAVAVGGEALAGQQAVATGAAAGKAGAQFRSHDAHDIRSWCIHTSGQSIPEVAADGLEPEGARMDSAAGTEVITLLYRNHEGERVSVSWLSGIGGLGWGKSVSRRVVNGHTVLVVTLGGRSAVVTGPDSDAWHLAASMEDKAGR
jgi:hypothetical protein